MLMTKIAIVMEQSPVNVLHETYRRECRYTRGIHIPVDDFRNILSIMCEEAKIYFDFHNPNKEIKQGTYLNGHAGLAKYIAHYFQQEKNIDVQDLTNGKDFYVKII